MNVRENQKKNTEPGEAASPAASDGGGREGGHGPTVSGFPFSIARASSLKLPHLLCIVVLITVADQVVKGTVVRRLYLHESIPVIPGIFSITRIHNSGIAFGLFPGLPDVFMVVTLISMLVVLFFYLTATPRGALLMAGCGLILGGAVGNLIDRFRLHYVIDFIDFNFWPAFNIADSAVVIGVALLMLSFYRAEKGTMGNASDTD